MRGNNLKIDINKDFLKEYKDNFYKGFSVSELVHIIAGAGCAGIIMYIATALFHIPVVISVYMSVPFVFPVIFLGIYKYQEYLKPKELLVERRYTQVSSMLHYETDEPDMTHYFTMHRDIRVNKHDYDVFNILREKVK